MTAHKRTLLAILAAALALSSCATIQRSSDEGSVKKIAQLINSGEAKTLSDMSTVPFLLDQEIVALPDDVAAFWQTAVKAGFRVTEPTLERGAPLTEQSYLEFSDSMEVRSFFRSHLSPGTRLLELKTSTGQRLLLLTSQSWFSTRIHGFKGPF